MILSLQINAFKVTAHHKQLSQAVQLGMPLPCSWEEREGSELLSSLLLSHMSSLLRTNLSHMNRAGQSQRTIWSVRYSLKVI